MNLEVQALTDPRTKLELSSFNRSLQGRVTVSGATNSNRRWELDNDSETLNIEGQRVCLRMIRAGLATFPIATDLISQGCKAIEWSLLPQIMGDGNWPQLRAGDLGNNTHPRVVFLNAACKSIHLLESSLYPLDRVWLTNIKAQLIKSALWILNSEDFKEFVETKNTMNQRFTAGAAMRITGLWSKNPNLLKMADFIYLDATKRMTSDGVLPEAYGYDWSYQSVSLESIALYIGTYTGFLSRPPAAVLSMLKQAATKWCSSIDDNGIVTVAGSRTQVSSYRNSAGPHGFDIDQYAQRARYVALAPLPKKTKELLLAKSKLLEFSGPDYEHIEE
jgi:hypothetical protein